MAKKPKFLTKVLTTVSTVAMLTSATTAYGQARGVVAAIAGKVLLN